MMGAPPYLGTGVNGQMALHVWVSERMWNGLVGPDDYAWTTGASALETGWLNPRAAVVDPAAREEGLTLIHQLYDLGSQAEGESDSHARAEIYGDFLTTCIDCHELTSAIIR
jgi:hypothetical protein